MLQSLLLTPQIQNSNQNNTSSINSTSKQYKFPQLSKYIENEFMKRSVEKEQEKRKSLQLQSNQIEKELNKILKQQLEIKVDQPQQILDQKLARAQFNMKNQFKIFEKKQIDIQKQPITSQKIQENAEQQEFSTRNRSSTVSARNQYININFTHSVDREQEQKQKELYYCNQVFDFKITPDIPNQYSTIQKNTIVKPIPNYLNYIQNNFTQGYQTVQKSYEKLKKQINYFKNWCLIIIFINRVSKLIVKKENLIKQKFKTFQQIYDQYNQQKIKQIEKLWCDKIIQNVNAYMKQKQFIIHFKFNKNPNEKDIILQRKKWLIELTKLFFQTVVEMTSSKNLDQEIILQAKYQILQPNNIYNSYIQKRVSKKFTQNEQYIIICEYIYYKLIIYSLLQNSNQQVYINEQHLAECKFQFVSLCSILQIMFQHYFKKYSIFQINQEQITKKLNIILDKGQYLELIDEKQSILVDEVISGFYGQTFYAKLIKDNKQWFKDIQQLFAESQKNLSSIEKF